ncbi:BTB/POZ domain-containing protein At5g47800 isoform X2 [Cannabis sativa]|uniref:Uncharacterized protein n=1 Tax=Cannabis sativa TaxID=3483 RepID=A0A7J6GAK7_CANSA|nr:BTB/POZ domain-containing protein At5g47800 isoform X2 [Cannabis sativa]XP_060972521.1 BTB/POZ domain-containing protein At5g47800 isoform X2 [Cannabis sativa]XP_060972525.1 BTB/POZ domain-containing protein At5g47800 isoform X2 [Cannabis sativa]XP_060972529.1 BTB/POZ domain-containing protein At5g47800 isoform X2 [Cannabis sativa]KAF4379149.1 hypothetical protein G4B88_010543 [Cannabis sativa]
MKFMKIGTRPDTFYTEEAVRTLLSDIPSDLSIQINNISYLLHKFALLPRCGLLQRLCSSSDESEDTKIELHDIPGGEDAFELCAKFCYGITINLSAHNFVPAFCAAKFLRMTESVEKGNFILKLEAFFNSCILEGWKDSIVALQTTVKLPEWSENLGIIRKCIDSIVEKILTPPAKVSWSYTYTRPGYNKKQHSVPKDWWTEDISDLDIDMFRCIITAIRTINILPSQLIGEALHVYARRWLPDTTKIKPPESSVSQADESDERSRRILETIVSMIPADKGSVSVGFLMRLVSTANYLGASPVTKTELLRKCSLQLEEATVEDLLFPSQSSLNQHFYDIDLVSAVVESFLVICKRQPPATVESSQFLRSLRKVGKLIDSYLQVVARDGNMPLLKVVSLAETIPDIARENHDDIYKAINIFLKEHPDLNKAEKKRLCRILDCQKLSPEVRSHAVKNERLPLRTVVQLLYFEQERGSSMAANDINKLSFQELIPRGKTTPNPRNDQVSKLKLGTTTDDNKSPKGDNTGRSTTVSEIGEKDHHHHHHHHHHHQHHQRMKRADGKLPLELEKKTNKGEIEEVEASVKKMNQKGNSRSSELGRDRTRDR